MANLRESSSDWRVFAPQDDFGVLTRAGCASLWRALPLSTTGYVRSQLARSLRALRPSGRQDGSNPCSVESLASIFRVALSDFVNLAGFMTQFTKTCLFATRVEVRLPPQVAIRISGGTAGSA